MFGLMPMERGRSIADTLNRGETDGWTYVAVERCCGRGVVEIRDEDGKYAGEL